MNYADYQAMRERAQQSDWKEIVMDEPIDHPLRTAIMEAIGAGSTCWESGDVPPGVFDSARATQIGNGLLVVTMEREAELVKAAAQAVARCLVYQELLRRGDQLLHDVAAATGWGTVVERDEVDMWRSAYRATLDYPPLADINELARDLENKL